MKNWIKLKDEDGHLRLVNLAMAQSISPMGKGRIRVVWKHDELVEVDDNDLPNDSCVYSEQVFVEISIQQIEMLLRVNGCMIDSIRQEIPNSPIRVSEPGEMDQKEWLGEPNGAAKNDTHVEEPISDNTKPGKKVVVSAKVPEDVASKVEEKAKEAGISKSEYIADKLKE